MIGNIMGSIADQNLEFGFDYLLTRSGFDMGDAWIQHTSHQSYLHAILSGLNNTLILAVACAGLSSILGIFFAILSTSHATWLIRISHTYVTIFRNIPLLVQILFFYTLMVYYLPPISESLQISHVYLSNRGLFFPKPPLLTHVPFLSFLITYALPLSRKIRINTQRSALVLWLIMLILSSWEMPERTRFSLVGGGQLGTEWITLFISLSMYSGSYIAECIRGGIEAIDTHQKESAQALGLSHIQIMIHVILPQARPIFMPALLNQYLNLTKNISLAIAIGYPDFFGITAGTILNQSGRSLECILIVMAAYAFMNVIGTHFIQKMSLPAWK